MIAALIRIRARRFLPLRYLGNRSMCYGRVDVLPDSAVPITPGEKVLETFTEEFEVGSRMIKLETGLLARFANGAVVCNMGDTHVLSTVACGKGDGSVRDFLPLTVEYQEKQYAKGAIPTTFTRREGPPRERELLCGRLIDRPIRPLFPAGFYHEVQIMINVLASDRKQDPDVMAANATSAALMLSDIPWEGPIGVIRLGRVDGRFIVNPSTDELTLSDLNLVYACTRDKTLMIDVQAREISEKDLEAGLRLAHPEAVKYIDPQLRLAEKAGKKKKEYTLSMITERTFEKIKSLAESPIEAVFTDSSYGKFERGEALEKITQNVKAKLEEECDEESIRVLPKVVDAVRKKIVRRRIIEDGLRVDGRCLDEVRPLYCKAHIFPALHGSSLFSRGDTQVLCTVTVGTPADSQRLDSLVGPSSKHFMLHYNFPPFSINEVGKRGGLNRREVGHGTLAEKALLAVLPPEEDFPYSYRLNSEVMASDGSTSMATVCGGSMALMDAGIPVRQHVAGISVGLISYMDPLTGSIREYRIVTDILGLEDHLGDMDFKIAGTRKGVTAIQLDIKPAGIPLDIICESLYHAKVGRLPILDRMEKEISRPRANALGLATRKYNNDSLWRFLNGYRKRKIEEETGARISLGDGTLTVVAKDQNAVEQALEKVDFIIGREIEVGGIYKGIVCSIKEYGAFVEFNGGQQGLLHISELSWNPVSKVSDAVSIGEELSLKCIGQDVRGNIKLSLKALQPQPQPIHYHATTNTPAKQSDEVSSSLDEVSNFIDSHLPKASQSEADYLDSAAYDTPEIVIRTAAECEALEAFHNQNDSQQCIETIKESSRSYTPLPLKNSEDSPELNGLFSREKSKLLVPNGEKKKDLQFTVDWGSSRKDTPGAPDATPKDICSKNNNSGSSLHPKNLKLGDRLTASVFQIRAHGLVLDLGGGLRGMYKFEEGVRRDFNVGMKVQVKCSSFSSKGIPVMSLIEE